MFRKLVIFLCSFFVLSAILYSAFIHYIPHKSATKSGVLIEIEHIGTLFKTWEAKLVEHHRESPSEFQFSIEPEKTILIDSLKQLQGNYVKIHYIERYNTLFWWGKTKNFLTQIKKETPPNFNLNYQLDHPPINQSDSLTNTNNSLSEPIILNDTTSAGSTTTNQTFNHSIKIHESN